MIGECVVQFDTNSPWRKHEAARPVEKREKAENETNDVIKHIQELCGFPEDSTMVKYMTQQGWASLIDITMLSLEEIKDFATTKEDGSFEAKPMLHHQRILKGFLLWYNRLSRDLTVTLDEDDVLGLTRSRFLEYCGSPEYHSDMAMGLSNTKRAPVISSSNPTATEDFTAQEFRKLCQTRQDAIQRLKGRQVLHW